MDHYTGGKWSTHVPKHHNENHMLSLEHSCWLSLVKYVKKSQKSKMFYCNSRKSIQRPE